MIKEVKGDLLQWVGKVDVIAHQVNCRGVMGGGIALQIKNKYPEVNTEYVNFCKTKHPIYLLGECQIVPVKNGYIANLFGQLNTGMGKQTDYENLHKALKDLANKMREMNLTSIAFPHKLGCGLAGGNWNIVKPMIVEVFDSFDTTIVEYDK